MSTAAERALVYHTRRWRALRTAVLRDAGYLCQCPDCQSDGRTMPAELVHHVKPWQEGKTEKRTPGAGI